MQRTIPSESNSARQSGCRQERTRSTSCFRKQLVERVLSCLHPLCLALLLSLGIVRCIVRNSREPVFDAFAEFRRLRGELRVGELFHLRLERVDGAHLAAVLLDEPVVPAADDLLEYRRNHSVVFQTKKGWESAP